MNLSLDDETCTALQAVADLDGETPEQYALRLIQQHVLLRMATWRNIIEHVQRLGAQP